MWRRLVWFSLLIYDRLRDMRPMMDDMVPLLRLAMPRVTQAPVSH